MPMCLGCPPGPSTSWWRLWGGVGHTLSRSVAYLRGPRRASGGVPRPAVGPHRVLYVFLDATYLKARDSVGHPASMAMGGRHWRRHRRGNHEILGCDLGDSESEGFWQQFLASLRARGSPAVRLVTADAHAGAPAHSRPPTHRGSTPRSHHSTQCSRLLLGPHTEIRAGLACAPIAALSLHSWSLGLIFHAFEDGVVIGGR